MLTLTAETQNTSAQDSIEIFIFIPENERNKNEIQLPVLRAMKLKIAFISRLLFTYTSRNIDIITYIVGQRMNFDVNE